ncbi:hypothetical protein WS67_01155 [Burkholderia singularis]|uniref:Glycosyltransferase n=1 Tax=Burkholderia singularis TaxID=1503053 RepID=A0A124P842_9BURK|nr:class I SAM-dependent methyltransferase [Burkholderia singularis]KVE24202.1 hypothetical protein WS67_01155 [Burkholderia singularis]
MAAFPIVPGAAPRGDESEACGAPATWRWPGLSAASFWLPEHDGVGTAHEYAPFVFWLTEAMAPRTLVALGARQGLTYLTFCQAVVRLNLATRCYAVGSGPRDRDDDACAQPLHAEQARTLLAALHDTHYAAISRRLPMGADDALPYFADGEVDLLHLDGRPDYDAALHDFRAWLPKLSARAVVVLHDIHRRQPGFGTWRLWQELGACYPSFALAHNDGLGVLGVGPQPLPALAELFAADAGTRTALHMIYARLGSAVSQRIVIDALDLELASRQDEFERLRHDAGTAHRLVSQAERELHRRNLDVAALREQLVRHLAEQAQQGADLRARLAERDARLSAWGAEREQAAHERARLHAQLASQSEALAELGATRARLRQLEVQSQQIQQTYETALDDAHRALDAAEDRQRRTQVRMAEQGAALAVLRARLRAAEAASARQVIRRWRAALARRFACVRAVAVPSRPTSR